MKISRKKIEGKRFTGKIVPKKIKASAPPKHGKGDKS